jgi:single-stranded-DNA-specific exonuclease
MNKTLRRRSLSGELNSSLAHLHPVLQRVFALRNVQDSRELDYRLTHLQPPDSLKGVAAAAQLLAQAIEQQWRILVVGDFDADGATASALAMTALPDMGASYVEFLVPNRFTYGYGLTPGIVAVAAQSQPELIITVDNGISSVDGVAAAKQAGIKVLVTDHHLAGSELPEADVIVNPNQPGCEFPSKNLAGVGVFFYVLVALRATLRQLNWFALNNLKEPNLASYLDLVALGTVADVVPLDSNNRLLVQQGLDRIRHGHCRPGILALLEVAGRPANRITSTDIGFVIGPRLNAAGRLDDMSIGIRCLLAPTMAEARPLAQELNELNQDRRAIETSMQREALKAIDQWLDENQQPSQWGLCLYHEDWHQGVVGILASRIKEKFHRPTIAFAPSDDGETLKGSARSITGLHIRDVLDSIAAENPGLVTKFGGHAMAAGLSLPKQHFAEFEQAFDQQVRKSLREDDLQDIVLTDGELSPADFTLPLACEIVNAGPWGQNFPEPVFDGEFWLLQQRIVGGKHLKLVLAPLSDKQNAIDAIAFNIDTEQWPDNTLKKVQVAYHLSVNEFKGRQSVQLMVRFIKALV